mmetsp:Transcript_2396/g.3644  ORF Transcript_2396/g.3644 Transcript_2396/m.3644 type:complete len:217 (+) Transcript_2396:400-1050(+)
MHWDIRWEFLVPGVDMRIHPEVAQEIAMHVIRHPAGQGNLVDGDSLRFTFADEDVNSDLVDSHGQGCGLCQSPNAWQMALVLHPGNLRQICHLSGKSQAPGSGAAALLEGAVSQDNALCLHVVCQIGTTPNHKDLELDRIGKAGLERNARLQGLCDNIAVLCENPICIIRMSLPLLLQEFVQLLSRLSLCLLKVGEPPHRVLNSLRQVAHLQEDRI